MGIRVSRFNTALTCVLLVTALFSTASLASLAQVATLPGKAVDIQVPLPPTPVRVNGKLQLVYELRLVNLTTDKVAFTRVSVLNVDQKPTVLGDFQGAQLSGLIAQTSDRTAGSGGNTVVYFWLTLDGSIAPRKVKHAIEFDLIRGGKRKHALAEGGEFTVGNVPPAVLDPPLRGGLWAAVYDPSMEGGHRRVQRTVEQRTRIPARYAIDWFKVDQDGKTARGDDSMIAD